MCSWQRFPSRGDIKKTEQNIPVHPMNLDTYFFFYLLFPFFFVWFSDIQDSAAGIKLVTRGSGDGFKAAASMYLVLVVIEWAIKRSDEATNKPYDSKIGTDTS